MTSIITAIALGILLSPLLMVLGIGLAHRCLAHGRGRAPTAAVLTAGVTVALIAALVGGLLANELAGTVAPKILWTCGLLSLLAGVAVWDHVLAPESDGAPKTRPATVRPPTSIPAQRSPIFR